MEKEKISNSALIRVKWFTHNDLDGVSCPLIAYKLFSNLKFSFNVSFLSYDGIDKIGEFFDNYDESRLFDFVFITDLNIKPNDFENNIRRPLSDFIQNKNSYENREKSNFFKKIIFIDHHPDSENTIRTIENEIFSFMEYYNDKVHCAAYQVYDFFMNNSSEIWTKYTSDCKNINYEDNKNWCEHYVELVNDWDLFSWKKNNNVFAKDLNILFTHIRRDKFMMMQVQKKSPYFSFTKREQSIIRETYEQIHKDYEIALKNLIVVNQKDLNYKSNKRHETPNVKYAIIKTDENTSLICDMIKERIINNIHTFPCMYIDYIVNVSFKYGTINFRRINDIIDCGEIARFYGGGGHPFAAGCPIDSKNEYIMEDFIIPVLSVFNKRSK